MDESQQTAAEPDLEDAGHVAWLREQLKHVDINDIPVLSTTVSVIESARDLGVILDSRLHYRRTSQRSVGPGTTNSGNYVHSSNR